MSESRTPKKRKFFVRFLVDLQNFPKRLWEIMGNFRFCDFATMRRLWKTGEKQGDQEWSPNFMVKNGQK